jgi:protein TonB
MKRFFFISAIFHGALLLLLFSWEVPPADRLLPKNILEVSLVEKIEKKIEGKKPQGAKPAPSSKVSKEKMVESNNAEATRQVALTNPQEKKEELKQDKVQPIQGELKEEEKLPSEERDLKVKGEEPLIVQARVAPQTVEGGDTMKLAHTTGGSQISGGKADSGTTFLVSTGPETEREGIQIGRGGKGSGSGKGEGGPTRLSNTRTSSQEGDPILFEIMRRIEAAKRYPRMARKMGIEGTAVVRFKLRSEGQVEAVEIMESSGSEILDKASIETVRDAAPLPYKDGWLKVGIAFKII